jgi:hypothetical protein
MAAGLFAKWLSGLEAQKLTPKLPRTPQLHLRQSINKNPTFVKIAKHGQPGYFA